MSDYDARQALEALLRDEREGKPHADIRTMIDQELKKGDEMDADLVAEALRDTAMTQPAFDMEANWSAIKKAMDQREHTTAPRKWYARRDLQAAAALVVFAMITVGITTEAWRWDSLAKVFQPMMATLGIHVNVADMGVVGEVDRSDTLASSESKTIREESEVPDTVRGIAAKPTWLPDGYAFQIAQVYNDFNESNLTITYRRGASELFVQTVVYAENSTLTAVNVVEKDDKETEVDDAITITENNGIVTANFEDGLTFYMVWGRLSRADISSVITSIR